MVLSGQWRRSEMTDEGLSDQMYRCSGQVCVRGSAIERSWLAIVISTIDGWMSSIADKDSCQPSNRCCAFGMSRYQWGRAHLDLQDSMLNVVGNYTDTRAALRYVPTEAFRYPTHFIFKFGGGLFSAES